MRDALPHASFIGFTGTPIEPACAVTWRHVEQRYNRPDDKKIFDGMKKSLDPIDLKLIEMLSENARRSLVALAKGVGLSRSATQERLERLQTGGVICGYTAVVRWPEDKGIEAWLTLKLDEGVKCAQVVPGILKLSGVRLCHALAGNLDILLRVTLPKASDVSELRDAVAAIAGVASVTTHLVLAEHR